MDVACFSLMWWCLCQTQNINLAAWNKQTWNSLTNLLILYSVVQVNKLRMSKSFPLTSLERGVTTSALFVPPSHHLYWFVGRRHSLTGFESHGNQYKQLFVSLPLPLIERQLDQERSPQCASWKKRGCLFLCERKHSRFATCFLRDVRCGTIWVLFLEFWRKMKKWKWKGPPWGEEPAWFEWQAYRTKRIETRRACIYICTDICIHRLGVLYT